MRALLERETISKRPSFFYRVIFINNSTIRWNSLEEDFSNEYNSLDISNDKYSTIMEITGSCIAINIPLLTALSKGTFGSYDSF